MELDEFMNDKSSKFWEASQKAKEVTVRYGKIDATGITKTFPFDTPKEAKDFLNKKRMEKEKKGYKTIKKKKTMCSPDKSSNSKSKKCLPKPKPKLIVTKKVDEKPNHTAPVFNKALPDDWITYDDNDSRAWLTAKRKTQLRQIYNMTLEMVWISERIYGHPEQYYNEPDKWTISPILSDVTAKEMEGFMRDFRSELARARKDLSAIPKPKLIVKTKVVEKPKLIVKSKSKDKPNPKLMIKTKKTKSLWDVKKDGVMLAHTFKDPKTGNIKNPPKGTPKAPNGWWLSEKYDGYRAIWDGHNFVSRAGNIFEAPQYFKNWMPTDIVLDGELFLGRECFEQCGLFRRKVPDQAEWVSSHVTYNIFDAPAHKGPFETRLDFIKKTITKQCALKGQKGKCPLQLVKQKKIKSEDELNKLFKALVGKGAEGVMLRAPNSPYDPKRSAYLLKVKQQFDDECRIIGYKEGTGKYKGKLGAFNCEMVKNKAVKFDISGMDDAIRGNYLKTHPIGTIVTFTYMGLSSKGVPRHPNYLRIRT